MFLIFSAGAILSAGVLFIAKPSGLSAASLWASSLFLALDLFLIGLEFLAWAQIVVGTAAAAVYILHLIQNGEPDDVIIGKIKNKRLLLVGSAVFSVSALLGLFKFSMFNLTSPPQYTVDLRGLGISLTQNSFLLGVIVVLVGAFVSFLGSMMISRPSKGSDQ